MGFRKVADVLPDHFSYVLGRSVAATKLSSLRSGKCRICSILLCPVSVHVIRNNSLRHIFHLEEFFSHCTSIKLFYAVAGSKEV